METSAKANINVENVSSVFSNYLLVVESGVVEDGQFLLCKTRGQHMCDSSDVKSFLTLEIHTGQRHNCTSY